MRWGRRRVVSWWPAPNGRPAPPPYRQAGPGAGRQRDPLLATPAKLDDFDARMDRRADQLDARLAVLDAIDARVYADELATTAGS